MSPAGQQKSQTVILAAVAALTAVAMLLIHASGAAYVTVFGTIALWGGSLFIITSCALKIAIPGLAARNPVGTSRRS